MNGQWTTIPDHAGMAGHADGGPCDRRNPQAVGEDGSASSNCRGGVESSPLLKKPGSRGQRFAAVMNESPQTPSCIARAYGDEQNRVAGTFAGLSGMAARDAQPYGVISEAGSGLASTPVSRAGSEVASTLVSEVAEVAEALEVAEAAGRLVKAASWTVARRTLAAATAIAAAGCFARARMC